MCSWHGWPWRQVVEFLISSICMLVMSTSTKTMWVRIWIITLKWRTHPQITSDMFWTCVPTLILKSLSATFVRIKTISIYGIVYIQLDGCIYSYKFIDNGCIRHIRNIQQDMDCGRMRTAGFEPQSCKTVSGMITILPYRGTLLEHVDWYDIINYARGPWDRRMHLSVGCIPLSAGSDLSFLAPPVALPYQCNLSSLL